MKEELECFNKIKQSQSRADLSSDIYLEIENEADPIANSTVSISFTGLDLWVNILSSSPQQLTLINS